MPYLSKERTAQIRSQIKKEFPNFKFSIRNENYSSVHITILEAPIDLVCGMDRNGNGHIHVNHYFIKENYENFPEAQKALSRINDIAGKGCGTESFDGDYGYVPDYYIRINVGQWDKPFVKR